MRQIHKNWICKKSKSAFYLGSLWNIPMHKIRCIFLIFNLVLHCPSPAQWSFRIILVFLQSTLQMNTQSSLSANMNNECQRKKSLPKSHITVPFKECQLEVSDNFCARIRKVTNIIFIHMNMMHCFFFKFWRERKDIYFVL